MPNFVGEMKNKSLLPHLTALVAMIIWGGSYVWSTQVFQFLKPGTTILLRLILSSAILFLAMILLKKTEKIERDDESPERFCTTYNVHGKISPEGKIVELNMRKIVQ